MRPTEVPRGAHGVVPDVCIAAVGLEAHGHDLVSKADKVKQTMPDLLPRVLNGEFDTTSLISHRLTLNDAPNAYKMFCNKVDGSTKVVMTPS